MITFTCCLIALIVGYFTYGKFVERVFGVDPSRVTPAFTKQDGVDYLPMISYLECFRCGMMEKVFLN